MPDAFRFRTSSPHEDLQFCTTDAEKERLAILAAEHACETIADYLRRVALGDESLLRRPRTLEVPMTADERAIVGRRATLGGFDSVAVYARERLLDHDTEGMTTSRAIMELRRVTGLQKHLFNHDQLRSREYADVYLKVGDAIEAVTAARGSARGALGITLLGGYRRRRPLVAGLGTRASGRGDRP